MSGKFGRNGPPSLEAVLGSLIPPGTVRPSALVRGLIATVEQRRFLAGHGVPSIPTRYVVSLNPADRVALEPTTEDRLARTVHTYAERSGYTILGEIDVELEADPEVPPGHPRFWAGFADADLMVLSNPRAAATVFARD